MKENIWFTSDTHFSHRNIVKYSTNRKNEFNLDLNDVDMLKKHDEALIRRWNLTIKNTILFTY